MIFSLLKLRKKTAAVLAGITIGSACLWGIALWQDIPPGQIFNLFLGSVILLLGIMLLAVLLVLTGKLFRRLASSMTATQDQKDSRGDDE